MAPFQAKIVWKTQRKRENKNCHSVLFRSYPTGNIKFQKIGKKFKKLKNTTMASFEAKTRWKSLRMRENKNYRSVPSLPDAKLKIPKKQR